MVSGLVSVVIPIFNEEESISELLSRLDAVICSESEAVHLEVVFVNDGSTDGSLSLLDAACQRFSWARLVVLSRNFGHQSAILAGVSRARGDAVILMDGDLQDPPELIPSLVAKWRDGFDVVYAIRRSRLGDGWAKRTSANLFYRCINWLSEVEFPRNVGDYRLISRRVIRILEKMPEKSLYLRGMVTWIGFPQTSVHFDRDARFAGRPKYTGRKMIALANDAVISFSERPLSVVTQVGMFFTVAAFGTGLFITGSLFFDSAPRAPGWLSIMLVTLGLGGIQIVSLGVIGQYIARIYRETKARPLFIVDEDRSRLD